MVDEEERKIHGIDQHMIPARHARLAAYERNNIHFILFCMLSTREIQLKETEKGRQLELFHNGTLDLFFDDVIDLFIEIETTGGYENFIKKGMIAAKGKLFARPESLLSFFQGVPVPVTDINVRIDNHDKKVIGDFMECFDKFLKSGPDSVAESIDYTKIANDTLKDFLRSLYRMMALTYQKRHFRDSIHKDTLELKISANFW